MATDDTVSSLAVNMNNWLVGQITYGLKAAVAGGLSQAIADQFQNAAQGTLDALQQCQQAYADVAQVSADVTLSDVGRLQKEKAIWAKAYNAGQSALATLNSAADNLRAKVESTYKRGKRASVDSVLLTEKVRQLERYLDAKGGGSPNGIAQAAAALYAQMDDRPASDEDAYYTQHALSYSMELYFGSRNVDARYLAQTMALAAAGHSSPSGTPQGGADLTALLMGGSATVQGFCTTAGIALYNANKDMQDMFTRLAGRPDLDASQQAYAARLQQQQAQAQASLQRQQTRLAGPVRGGEMG